MDRMKGQKSRRQASHPASVSFPPETFETLGGIARQKKFSVVWVVRVAAEKHVAEQWPLFATDQNRRV